MKSPSKSSGTTGLTYIDTVTEIPHQAFGTTPSAKRGGDWQMKTSPPKTPRRWHLSSPPQSRKLAYQNKLWDESDERCQDHKSISVGGSLLNMQEQLRTLHSQFDFPLSSSEHAAEIYARPFSVFGFPVLQFCEDCTEHLSCQIYMLIKNSDLPHHLEVLRKN